MHNLHNITNNNAKPNNVMFCSSLPPLASAPRFRPSLRNYHKTITTKTITTKTITTKNVNKKSGQKAPTD